MKRNNDLYLLRLPEEEKKEVEQAAAEDQMYISEFIRSAIRQALRRRKRIKAQQAA